MRRGGDRGGVPLGFFKKYRVSGPVSPLWAELWGAVGVIPYCVLVILFFPVFVLLFVRTSLFGFFVALTPHLG